MIQQIDVPDVQGILMKANTTKNRQRNNTIQHQMAAAIVGSGWPCDPIYTTFDEQFNGQVGSAEEKILYLFSMWESVQISTNPM